MLVAAAVCPCPPLLVPQVAAGAAAELEDARTACAEAVARLAAARPERLVVVGPSPGRGQETFPAGTRGSFRGYGVDLAVRLGAGSGDVRDGPAGPELPPALTVGAWLLDHSGWDGAPAEGLAIGGETDPDRCAAAGRELAAGPERLALLVMGDGSACRTLKAPGYYDERAEAFDTAAARALAHADPAALAALDDRLAAEVQAAGRPSWQLLAGAARGADLTGRLLYEEAPYGVGYFVASWT
ncbi:class III extradiol dioxygenase subunit B-like domain-containing protein [Streptomyces sp. ACA25]|uniref:class III extradiol dioxygenase subunit B-like domain-containing protein n=1 Tax=Streptomyces sp. ACA25 TaxID=3022596 RepID=UPI0023072722|nr:class III extradiol dioxygenase subunit B-like domain-containing protein [Streptomyces sp. ACA25]MDB1088844.1 class III extradiol dioxygenase subunit B-like domain-containing protein [Streptomyces sp. ACA25]